ncbi:Crp/Fnr family transcriptional regulator [Noviherbaspirillum suwonense]|jgi:CRP-like cAMP-binding protein|uniref:cAMP-binding domain of CRP or a regulatory subunit of cAMP-dependent protein kinases n=1 Tax=Noviherbaspirillum suwonense TaxID=1224511 RepID=A0ABY1QGZ2_9BURK|nr:Crp/Fnr family transcriptional regulator [Noviherbaspirillum suwonense]SMP68127.1 cAMP-binding domain of CRP or a regulatory subunit of cAMP-dependent protein kinases [Noviherbaspirillum suwonense]
MPIPVTVLFTLDQNKLLAALPASDRERLAEHLEPVLLHAGDVLCDAGVIPSHIYFPANAVLSILHLMEDGASSELVAVGNEGMVGISLFMGGAATAARTVVQTGGHCLRLRADLMRAEFERGGPAMDLLLRYTQAFMAQMAQNAICNRYHKIEQHLCRWLLQNLDRAGGDEVDITHSMLAGILGVRREGVSEAAARLQLAGGISYRRGHVKVLDRAILESQACDCYRTMQVEFSRLLPPPGKSRPAVSCR